MKLQSPRHPLATYAGLLVALLGIPAFVECFRLITGEHYANMQIIGRDVAIFALVGLLLWIVTAHEKLPLSSIGLHFDKLGKSILWGFALTVISLIITVGLYVVLQQFGIQLGSESGDAFRPSLWVVSLGMLRAGVAEETFYRGYAIERLQSITGSRWLAGLIPLAIFASAHYRQGAGGIFATFVLGGVFTFFYMKRRDLVANIIGHFLEDFVLNVVLPLVGSG